MELLVSSVDYNPPELAEQVPFKLTSLREFPGPDRPDYWLAASEPPLRWIDHHNERYVDNVVICARWDGAQIAPGLAILPINISYVVDKAQLVEPELSFGKCRYVAIGIASDISEGQAPTKLDGILTGTIARSFGLRKRD
jgi:hypothetical protein